VNVAVVVPVKAFHDAKHRLAPVLDHDQRAALARDLATRVVHAARGLRVFVVCDDDDVAQWAESVGATVLWRPAKGLDDAAEFGVRSAAELSVDRVIVAHGDLPRARDLTGVGAFDGITLVPDRHDDGTNVLCVPVSARFAFAYGPGSFERHLAAAERTGLPVRILRDAALAWDVDVPDDLTADDGDGTLTADDGDAR
jgi:2-phospho-L-lactate guanylyltransferase